MVAMNETTHPSPVLHRAGYAAAGLTAAGIVLTVGLIVGVTAAGA